MRVLIIGGSGFLGIHLAEELAKKGYMINILDIKKPKNLNKNVKFFNGDITKSFFEKTNRGSNEIAKYFDPILLKS